MEQTVLDAGWDGEWYLRAYDHFKNKVGSHECEEGKIFIEPQDSVSMAGIGLSDGYCIKALESVEKHLDTKYGIVLLQPPYLRYHTELGEISSYPPGYKENAGIFCHNNPWISSPRQSWEEETVHGASTPAHVRLILKISATSTVQNRMYIHR